MDIDLTPEKPGGVFGKFYCSSPHPTRGDVWCRRQPGHTGNCKAFVLSIVVPDEWDNPDE